METLSCASRPQDSDRARSKQVDDVGRYLDQIGRIPLLTRQEEIKLAQQIEGSRQKFVQQMYRFDLVVDLAIELLRRVERGELTLEAALEIPQSDRRDLRDHFRQGLRQLSGCLVHDDREIGLAGASGSRLRRREALCQAAPHRRPWAELLATLPIRSEHLESWFRTLGDASDLPPESVTGQHRSASSLGQQLQPASPGTATHDTVAGLPRRVRSLTEHYHQYHAARHRLAQGNLRLVVAIAKPYADRGVDFLDLIQEGNAGLMRAVDRFDYRREVKFATYASCWIRQAISLAIATQPCTIRIPQRLRATTWTLRRISHVLRQQLGREPSEEEIAEASGTTIQQVRRAMSSGGQPLSLDDRNPGDAEANLCQLLADRAEEDPGEMLWRGQLSSAIDKSLKLLDHLEREVLSLRFGLRDGNRRSLRAVGEIFRRSHTWVNNIELNALRKIQESSLGNTLASFL